MNAKKNRLENTFLFSWVLGTAIAWPVGVIIAFILHYTIVNIFYHEETNLILGLCVGAVVGYIQWLVLRKNLHIKSFWVLSCSIGIGLPFIIDTILYEIGIKEPYFPNYEILSWFIIGLIGGFITGLLQIRLLKPYYTKTIIWLLASPIGWGLCFSTMKIQGLSFILSVTLGGIPLGVITGIGILRMNRF